MRIILSIALLFLTVIGARATHVQGADIRYTAEGSVYRIHLTIYTTCTGVQAPLTAVVQGASSCGLTFSRTLPQISKDTLKDAYCPGSGGCNSGALPYSVATYYSDTVSLPACSSWKIGYSECCRDASIGNLLNAGSTGLYVEAFLNNAQASNSSAKQGNQPPFIIHRNSVNTVPIPATDVDGDSIVYELVPAMSTANTPATYLSPYSATQPLGGNGTSINAAQQLLQLQSPTVGKYVIALRVKDYRNGQLVGYTQRDWALLNLTTTDTEIPLPAPGSVFMYNTCPGQNINNITVSFADSIATDSVYLSFEPSVPWAFTTTGGTGVGSATGTISWSTPAGVNPATLPYFYIRVTARDNACPIRGIAWYDILVKVGPCTIDSVWPGDANGSYEVNLYDPLAIAVAYGETGPVRPGANATWTPQYCPDWSGSFPNGVNYKHADCDGNGTVNLLDLGPVASNYGQFHLKGSGPLPKVAGIPDLHFESAGVSLTPGATVSIPLKLGSSALPMNDVYGVAARVEIVNLQPVNPKMTYANSWIGTAGNTLNFERSLAPNVIDWAYARTDQQNVSGSGTIVSLQMDIPANAQVGSQVIFRIWMPRIIDRAGNVIEQYNVLDDTATIQSATSISSLQSGDGHAVVVPNPSGGDAALWFRLDRATPVTVSIINALGQTVGVQHIDGKAALNQWALPAAGLPAGTYLIRVVCADGAPATTVRWLLQR